MTSSKGYLRLLILFRTHAVFFVYWSGLACFDMYAENGNGLDKESFMILEILLVSTWLASPLMAPQCFVIGEVLHTPQETQVHLATNCLIQVQQAGAMITMTSSKWIVKVAIPEFPAKQPFVYQWGKAEALIGDGAVEVSYGPVGGV